MNTFVKFFVAKHPHMTFDDANEYAEKNNLEIVSANFCDSTRFQALIVVFKKPIVIDCVGASVSFPDHVILKYLGDNRENLKSFLNGDENDH